MNSNSNPHHYHLHQQQHLSPYPTPPPSTEKCGGSRIVQGNNGGMSYIEENEGSAMHPGSEHPMSHPHPPTSWVKSHHQPPLHHLSGGSPSSNHGASHNYLQQSFYPEPPPPTHGSHDSGGTTQRLPYAPPPPCSYYAAPDPRVGVGDYYHQHQTPQFASFGKSGNRRQNQGGGETDDPCPSANFYAPTVASVPPNFYDSNHHHSYVDFHAQEYSRMNYNSGGGGSSGGSGADYFTGPCSTNRTSSTCPSYGHHHVSTPLEFHQHSSSHHNQSRSNSIPMDSYNNAEAGDSFSKYCYASGTREHKRESVIGPPWATGPPSVNPESQGQGDSSVAQESQYFYTGGQYSRQPTTSPLGLTRRCESVPGHGHGSPLTPPTPPSCSFDDGQFKKVGGVKQRSQSLSYSRNYEPHLRGGTTYLRNHYGTTDPTKYVPAVSSSPDLSGSRFPSEGRPGRKLEAEPAQAEIMEPAEDDGEESESASGSSSTSSPAASPPSADSNESDGDDMSDMDLEEELKKEIQSVTTTTTTDGSRDTDVEPNPEVNPQGSSDPSKFFEETELSNSSLTLFDSIALNTFDSPAPGESGRVSDLDTPVENRLIASSNLGQRCDLDDSLTGLNSIISRERDPPSRHLHRRPHSKNSTTVNLTEPKLRSRSTSPVLSKVIKLSFNEGDKDLAVKPTAVTPLKILPTRSRLPLEIQVPPGWRREIVLSEHSSSAYVYYFSPSETKLRSFDELKNYVTSDGTCKCGLSCPLHLELTFNFDPKVSNGGLGDEGLPGDKGGKQHRSSCSHQSKRKIPLSEDSPLISSTRDDLGDSGDGEDEGRKPGAKKRRTEPIETTTATILATTSKIETKNSTSTSVIPSSPCPVVVTTPTTPIPPAYNQNVVIPFSQQSPDTTTQTTPQRDMSPALSISSDTLIQGGRSTNSTPTPVGVKTSPVVTLTVGGGKGQGSEFVWPVLPSGTTPLVRPQTPPSGSSPNTKKNKYQHHLISKSPGKRAASPCPNVDVRQIPIEQNQPPPRPRQGPSVPITSSTSGASQNSNVSLVSIANSSTTTCGGDGIGGGTLTPTLNAGYSISPILPSSLGNNVQFTSILPTTTSVYGTDLGMPRLVNSTPPILSTGVHTTPIPSCITISVVGTESSPKTGKSSVTLPKLVQKSRTACEKSPLQLVQDVVNRFETDDGNGSGGTEEGKTENEPTESVQENLTLESKILKIIADAASASGKTVDPNRVDLLKPVENSKPPVIRYGMNVNVIPASSSSCSQVPMMTSHPMPFQSLGQTIFTSNATTLTTTSNSNSANVPIMTSNSILSCGPGVTTSNTGINLNNGNQLILQQQPDPNNPSLRYPIFQALQPIFLNPGGGPTPLLIPNSGEPQSFIQIDQNNQAHTAGDLMQGTTMVIDPMSMCTGGNLLGPGPKKKKKRLSKKQQQQQAQLQLQQQLLLQQLFNHQQVQQQHVQAAQQQIPLLLPPSFNLGPQGFLQPMNMNMNMNFYPTPTILTLPNLILNPADGTLFIQQAGPQLSSNQAVPPVSQIPPQLKLGPGMQVTTPPNSIVLPRKDIMTLTPSTIPGMSPVLTTTSEGIKSIGGELGIDDSSRQNATPDSSTNDCQLGNTTTIVVPSPSTTPITVSLPLGSSTNLQGSKKAPLKSKVVSSSTATTVHKRILPQKQILPKIDSTTPSVENNN